jgi:hypothetical protein
LKKKPRQRAEADRLRKEQERAIAEARTQRRRLASEANRWTQATRIRDYVAHIRAAASDGDQATGGLVEWIEWALSVATTLDPTEVRLGQIKPESTDSSLE